MKKKEQSFPKVNDDITKLGASVPPKSKPKNTAEKPKTTN